MDDVITRPDMHFRACVLHVALVLAHPSLCAYVGRGGSRVAKPLCKDEAASSTIGSRRCSGHRSQSGRMGGHFICMIGSEAEHVSQLEAVSLPDGFRAGTCGFEFAPAELEGTATAVMNITLLALDEPTSNYAAIFTRNRFPGAPVRVGKQRLAAGKPLQAIAINNKISNVCAGGDGVAASEEVCRGAAEALGLEGGAEAVLPLSTGVIGWRLPLEQMVGAMPDAVTSLNAGSALPAAKAILE